MEDAMVVYRVTRAPERRVFNIDTGALPPPQAEQFVERQRLKFRKKSFINKNGQLDWRANTMAPDEDFWLAKRNGSEGTSIDTLPGAENLGEVDDVKYFKDKIFAALKIPRVFLQDTEGIDARKSNTSQQDIMFARTVERVQGCVIEGLKKIAIVHLMLRGYKETELDNFEIRMTPPSDLRERLSLEISDLKTASATALAEYGFPKSYINEKVFDVSETEWKKLRKRRFEEKMEETAVDGGTWTPDFKPGQPPAEEGAEGEQPAEGEQQMEQPPENEMSAQEDLALVERHVNIDYKLSTMLFEGELDIGDAGSETYLNEQETIILESLEDKEL
jgi:hypothetical protein